MFGPSDPELWQKRPLGYWESQLVLDFPPGVPGTLHSNFIYNIILYIKCIYVLNIIITKAGNNSYVPVSRAIRLFRHSQNGSNANGTVFLGPRRCTIASVSQLSTECALDISVWEESVQHCVYTEPQLRADVDTTSSPPCWLPATDFSQVFSFQDLSHFRSEQVNIFQN